MGIRCLGVSTGIDAPILPEVKSMTMQETKELCPACGCTLGVDAVTKEGVMYCCRSCAEGGACECSDCSVTKLPPPEG
jgi:hypothetical protein